MTTYLVDKGPKGKDLYVNGDSQSMEWLGKGPDKSRFAQFWTKTDGPVPDREIHENQHPNSSQAIQNGFRSSRSWEYGMLDVPDSKWIKEIWGQFEAEDERCEESCEISQANGADQVLSDSHFMNEWETGKVIPDIPAATHRKRKRKNAISKEVEGGEGETRAVADDESSWSSSSMGSSTSDGIEIDLCGQHFLGSSKPAGDYGYDTNIAPSGVTFETITVRDMSKHIDSCQQQLNSDVGVKADEGSQAQHGSIPETKPKFFDPRRIHKYYQNHIVDTAPSTKDKVDMDDSLSQRQERPVNYVSKEYISTFLDNFMENSEVDSPKSFSGLCCSIKEQNSTSADLSNKILGQKSKLSKASKEISGDSRQQKDRKGSSKGVTGSESQKEIQILNVQETASLPAVDRNIQKGKGSLKGFTQQDANLSEKQQAANTSFLLQDSAARLCVTPQNVKEKRRKSRGKKDTQSVNGKLARKDVPHPDISNNQSLLPDVSSSPQSFTTQSSFSQVVKRSLSKGKETPLVSQSQVSKKDVNHAQGIQNDVKKERSWNENAAKSTSAGAEDQRSSIQVQQDLEAARSQIESVSNRVILPPAQSTHPEKQGPQNLGEQSHEVSDLFQVTGSESHSVVQVDRSLLINSSHVSTGGDSNELDTSNSSAQFNPSLSCHENHSTNNNSKSSVVSGDPSWVSQASPTDNVAELDTTENFCVPLPESFTKDFAMNKQNTEDSHLDQAKSSAVPQQMESGSMKDISATGSQNKSAGESIPAPHTLSNSNTTESFKANNPSNSDTTNISQKRHKKLGKKSAHPYPHKAKKTGQTSEENNAKPRNDLKSSEVKHERSKGQKSMSSDKSSREKVCKKKNGDEDVKREEHDKARNKADEIYDFFLEGAEWILRELLFLCYRLLLIVVLTIVVLGFHTISYYFQLLIWPLVVLPLKVCLVICYLAVALLRFFLKLVWILVVLGIGLLTGVEFVGKPDQKSSRPAPAQTHAENVDLPANANQVIERILSSRDDDLYEILGVHPGADEEAIKKYYRKQSILVHPDKSDHPSAQQAFQKLSRAYETLSDPNLRRQHDASKTFEEQKDEIFDLIKKRMEELNTTLMCNMCNKRHPKNKVDRSPFAARYCSDHSTHHPAQEGDIWAESSFLGLKVSYLCCMDDEIFEVTEWVRCQGVPIHGVNACRPSARIHVQRPKPHCRNHDFRFPGGDDFEREFASFFSDPHGPFGDHFPRGNGRFNGHQGGYPTNDDHPSYGGQSGYKKSKRKKGKKKR